MSDANGVHYDRETGGSARGVAEQKKKVMADVGVDYRANNWKRQYIVWSIFPIIHIIYADDRNFRSSEMDQR